MANLIAQGTKDSRQNSVDKSSDEKEYSGEVTSEYPNPPSGYKKV